MNYSNLTALCCNVVLFISIWSAGAGTLYAKNKLQQFLNQPIMTASKNCPTNKGPLSDSLSSKHNKMLISQH